jgi:very-short-patch-repair endonuclease
MSLIDTAEKLWPLVLLIVVIGVARGVIKGKGRTTETPRAKRPLTEREQAMYFRLVQAMPDHVVMPQVAFSALLDAKSIGARNTFDRKTADFVVCGKGFEVTAVIELDDSSHKGRSKVDAAREGLLTKAGYRVVRFNNVPNVEDARRAITKATTTRAEKTAIIV